MAKDGGSVTIDGEQMLASMSAAKAGITPQPAHDGREYWRRRAFAAELVILRLQERIAALVKGAT